MSNVIPEEYWDSQQGRYDSHRYFNTINNATLSSALGDKPIDSANQLQAIFINIVNIVTHKK